MGNDIHPSKIRNRKNTQSIDKLRKSHSLDNVDKDDNGRDSKKKSHQLGGDRDKALRKQYFTKLSQTHLKEQEERISLATNINQISWFSDCDKSNANFSEIPFDCLSDVASSKKRRSISNKVSESLPPPKTEAEDNHDSDDYTGRMAIIPRNNIMENETMFDHSLNDDIDNSSNNGFISSPFEKPVDEILKLTQSCSNEDMISHCKSRVSSCNEYELQILRNGEELRRAYISKLIYSKIWTPQKPKNHNTLIIFDWDDTLLPTSFLTPNGVFKENLTLSDKENELLIKLEFNVLRLLTSATEKGDTYIITNSAPGWVEYSAEKFYPSVSKLFKKIKVINARNEYESVYPGDMRMWKIQAFTNMQKNFDSELVTNIICLGDSFIEVEAGQALASKFSQAFIKIIKFRESPHPEELNKQLGLVADQFQMIYSAIRNLTIKVEKKR